MPYLNTLTASCSRLSRAICCSSGKQLTGCRRDDAQYPLNAPCQRILQLCRHKGVFASHFQIAMTGYLRCFDCTPAHLLSPCDVRAAERVRPQPCEVAALRLRSLMQRVPYTRAPRAASPARASAGTRSHPMAHTIRDRLPVVPAHQLSPRSLAHACCIRFLSCRCLDARRVARS